MQNNGGDNSNTSATKNLDELFREGVRRVTNHMAGVSADTTQVAVGAAYQGVSEAVQRTMSESKIGQRVPHLDTPPFRFGYGFTQNLATFFMRQPRMPLPKLQELESVSDLYTTYGEAYPQRLDLMCVAMATLPLLCFKIQNDLTFQIYVGPFASMAAFSKHLSRVPKKTGVALSKLSRKVSNVVLTQTYIQQYVFDTLIEYGLLEGKQLHAAIEWSRSEVKSAAEAEKDEQIEFQNNANDKEKSGGLFGYGKMDDSYIHVDGAAKPQQQHQPGFVSRWTPTWLGGSSPSQLQRIRENGGSPMALDDEYIEVTISKDRLRQAVKVVGFGYCVPGLVFPQQLFSGVHLALARCRGPLTPGQKIYHPLEELVTMLPSLSSPEKEKKGWASTAMSSWVGVTALVVGCGLVGVVFGRPGRLS